MADINRAWHDREQLGETDSRFVRTGFKWHWTLVNWATNQRLWCLALVTIPVCRDISADTHLSGWRIFITLDEILDKWGGWQNLNQSAATVPLTLLKHIITFRKGNALMVSCLILDRVLPYKYSSMQIFI